MQYLYLSSLTLHPSCFDQLTHFKLFIEGTCQLYRLEIRANDEFMSGDWKVKKEEHFTKVQSGDERFTWS